MSQPPPDQLLRVRCPSCGRAKSVPPTVAGQAVLCIACGAQFQVAPMRDGAVPLPAPPPVPVTGPTVFPPGVMPPKPTFAAGPPPPVAGMRSAPDLSDPADAPHSGMLKWLIAAGALVVVISAAAAVALVIALSHEGKPAVAASPPPVAATEPAAPAPKPAPPQARPVAPEVARVLTPRPAPVVIIPPPPAPVVHHGLIPVTPAAPPFGEDLDDRIGQSISRGMTYLLSQFNEDGTLLTYDPQKPVTAGEDALAVYALLQAGEATNDDRVGVNKPDVDKMLTALKGMEMDRSLSTYCRSLRSAALSVYHRGADRKALQADCDWLVNDATDGAYTYFPPPASVLPKQSYIGPGTMHPPMAGRGFARGWDNSNSQYGALGVWSASETQAGIEVPSTYWPAVHQHWVSCQLDNGEWGYNEGLGRGELSMTVAGITTLFVAEDNMDIRTVAATLGRPPFSPQLQKGLDWLEEGDHSVALPFGYETYNLYGLERAALASGFKYFGTHDWYRELAIKQLAMQGQDGSWRGDIVDTAYSILFLSRGRHPILMNKLRFDGFWSNRPRDLMNLARFTSKEMERPINWQVVSLKADWSDWMDAPILYIASHMTPKFSDDDCRKLRAYADNGGLIFTHADGDSPEFTSFVRELCQRVFPEYPFQDLPKDDLIYRTQYHLKPPPRLMGVSNGSRLLLVHSPIDINKAWQQRDWTNHPQQYQEGIDLFFYAAGKVNLKNKLKTSYVPEPRVPRPVGKTTIARLQYEGNWNPEPAAVPRFARLFLSQTSIRANVVDQDPTDLDPSTTRMAFLTGTGAAQFKPEQFRALHTFVTNGGVLLIDACGGSPDFDKAILTDILPHAFPDTLPTRLPTDHPIRAGTGPGMTPLTLKLRPSRLEIDSLSTRPLEYFVCGKGLVIVSHVDISTGLLGTNTWPVNGYDPEAAYDIARNTLLYAVERDEP